MAGSPKKNVVHSSSEWRGLQQAMPADLPESYRAAWEANPYANQVATGGLFGIGKHKEQKQLDLNAREYYANLINQARAEQYNSASEQVERLREAGINPDLSGGISAGDATAPSGVEQSGVDFSDGAEQALSLTDTLLNLAALSMSLPSGLANIQSQFIDNGVKLSSIGQSLAQAFPEEQINIAPGGSGLAPVMVSNPISGSRIADSIPYLSTNQKKKVARSFDMYRKSLKTQLSQFGDRYQLQKYLNSPELSMPKEAANIIKLETGLHLIELKYDLKIKEALAKNAEAIASKTAENAVNEGVVVGREQEARSRQADAAKSVAAAQAAEAGVRSEIARATDGTAIGEARSADAIRAKYQAEAAQEQLKLIEEAEDEGLFHSSFVGDILSAKIGRNTRQEFARVAERRRKRTEAKRAHKNIYHGNYSGMPDVTISPKGVGVSTN